MHGKENISLMKRTLLSGSILERHMFYLYIQHRNKHKAWHLKGQILNWSYCSNIFPCNEKQKQLRQSSLSLPFLALLCMRELDSRAISGLVYPCLLPADICFSFPATGMPKGWNLCRMSSWPLLLGIAGAQSLDHGDHVLLQGWVPGTPATATDGDRAKRGDIGSSASPGGVKTLQAQRQSGKDLAERWYNCSAEHSHNGSCNHQRKQSVCLKHYFCFFWCKYRNYDFMSRTLRDVLLGLFYSISEL